MVNLGPLNEEYPWEPEPYFSSSSMDDWASWPTYFSERRVGHREPSIEMEWQCVYCGEVHPPDTYKCWDGVSGCGASKDKSVSNPIRAYNPSGWNSPR